MSDNYRRFRSIRTSLSQMHASEPEGSYPERFWHGKNLFWKPYHNGSNRLCRGLHCQCRL